MRAWIAVTDKDWYRFLSRRTDLDEVNFWQPGGSRAFSTLSAGEPFLFKLHYPDNAIGQGYMTVTSDYRFLVSPRLKRDFDDGEPYYPLSGKRVWLPDRDEDRPSREFLEWHADTVYRG